METGEITFEPFSAIAADDQTTCAAYAKRKIYTPLMDGKV